MRQTIPKRQTSEVAEGVPPSIAPARSKPAFAVATLGAGVVTVVSPLTDAFQQLGQQLLNATRAARSASGHDKAVLAEEAARQKLEMEIIERQARAAQEAAIAERIRYSHNVEIEEFYDAKTGGFLGSDRGNVGVSAEARKVVRRTYRFEGNRITEAEAVTAASEAASAKTSEKRVRRASARPTA